MTPRAKLALGGAVVVGGLLAVFATKSAKADTPSAPTTTPKPNTAAWPADGMPWMMYSVTTLNRQRAYNAAVRAANTSLEDDPPLFSRPYLAEDGVLGPDSCTQLSYWQSWGGPSVPIACRVGNI